MSELLLIIMIAGERVAIDAKCVQTVIEMENLTPAPRAPSFVAGLTALRSRAITVIDCRASLELDDPKNSWGFGVVVEHSGLDYALLVDAVEDVSRAKGEPVEVRAELAPGWTRCALGMVETDAGPMLLVDPAQIIAGPAKREAA